MTRDDILNMPEKELFKHIYKQFGITVKDRKDIKGAWEMVEQMHMAIIPLDDDRGWAAQADNLFPIEMVWFERPVGEWASAPTAPLAICKAALLTVLDE
jgi:hypothetical protein